MNKTTFTRFASTIFLAAVISFLSIAAGQKTFSAPPQTRNTGFSAAHAAEQSVLEEKLKAAISTAEIRKQHRYHHVPLMERHRVAIGASGRLTFDFGFYGKTLGSLSMI
jgi:hypothetical protein